MQTPTRVSRLLAAFAFTTFLAATAVATINNGRLTGTAPWVHSPGGGACNFPWAVDWFVDDNTNTITLNHSIQLNTAAGSAAITAAEITNWETRIEGRWNTNDIYIVAKSPNGTTKDWTIRYDITMSTTKPSPDYTVTIHDGSGGSNTSNWYRTSGGGFAGVNDNGFQVPAHEVGHFLACPDEYTNGGCITPGSVHNHPANSNTSLMNGIGGSQVLSPRHYHLWHYAMSSYDLGKGIGDMYNLVPTPGTGALVCVTVTLLARRRRAA